MLDFKWPANYWNSQPQLHAYICVQNMGKINCLRTRALPGSWWYQLQGKMSPPGVPNTCWQQPSTWGWMRAWIPLWKHVPMPGHGGTQSDGCSHHIPPPRQGTRNPGQYASELSRLTPDHHTAGRSQVSLGAKPGFVVPLVPLYSRGLPTTGTSIQNKPVLGHPCWTEIAWRNATEVLVRPEKGLGHGFLSCYLFDLLLYTGQAQVIPELPANLSNHSWNVLISDSPAASFCPWASGQLFRPGKSVPSTKWNP